MCVSDGPGRVGTARGLLITQRSHVLSRMPKVRVARGIPLAAAVARCRREVERLRDHLDADWRAAFPVPVCRGVSGIREPDAAGLSLSLCLIRPVRHCPSPVARASSREAEGR